MWQIVYSTVSYKTLNRLDKGLLNLVKKKVGNLKEWLDDEAELTVDIKKLKGKWEGFYRIRVRKIRVLITIDSEYKVIKIHNIGSRGNIYKM